MREKHPMTNPTHADAVHALASTFSGEELAGFIVRSLVPAGAHSEWEAETIEQVLGEYEGVLATAGLPWIGSTGVDGENHFFWATIAEELGYDHDYEFAEEEDDEKDDDDLGSDEEDV